MQMWITTEGGPCVPSVDTNSMDYDCYDGEDAEGNVRTSLSVGEIVRICWQPLKRMEFSLAAFNETDTTFIKDGTTSLL